MAFETSRPVWGPDFFDRERELEELLQAAQGLVCA
jgi:hypothetical protein